MALRLTRLPVTQVRQATVDSLAPVLQRALADWTLDDVRAFIRADKVPRELADVCADHVLKHPDCATLSSEEFTVAVESFRPDLARELRTPEGQRWLLVVPSMLGGSVARAIMRAVVGGPRKE